LAIRDIQTAVDAFLGLTEEEKAIFSKEVAAGKKRGRKPGFKSSRKGKKLGPRKAKEVQVSPPAKRKKSTLDETFPKNEPVAS
jgi:hypothetical protein